MTAVAFTIPGIPAPQGSKTPWGTEANKNTRPWRATVSAAAAEKLNGDPLLTGPLECAVLFVFPRPKSHYRTGRNAHELRATAPAWHTSKPDADKLQRAIGDALTGVLIRDDALICAWKVEKRYGEPARAVVAVAQLTPDPAD